MEKKLCLEENCDKSAYSCNRCWHHYRLMRIRNEPDYLEREARRKLQQRRDNPELDRKSRARGLAKNYGLSIEQYEEMMENSMGLCDICETCPEPFIRKGKPVSALCVDHCHVTGKIRGILCKKCNSAIGYLRDNTTVLQAAINYLVINGHPVPSPPETAF